MINALNIYWLNIRTRSTTAETYTGTNVRTKPIPESLKTKIFAGQLNAKIYDHRNFAAMFV